MQKFYCFRKYLPSLLLIQLSLAVFINAQNSKSVQIRKDEAKKRVDVLVDGKLFTSYIWSSNLKRPILYPIKTSKGTSVTRGFPLEPRTGESVDHPHQVGLWLSYGDVNGIDFWNNSIYRRPEEVKHMGTVVHRKIIRTTSGNSRGDLKVQADWLMPDGKVILNETTEFVFRAGKDFRSIDRITMLRALDQNVIFNDTKEGMFGMRVSRELEQPAKEPIRLVGADGQPSAERILDNKNISGEYSSSEGKVGDDVWGTRAKWALLSGKVDGEEITLAIFDDPKNVGFPTYWMTRGYGLFAANPLGQKAYATEKREQDIKEMKFTLGPKRSVRFRFRLVILSQKETPEQIESLYREFIKESK